MHFWGKKPKLFDKPHHAHFIEQSAFGGGLDFWQIVSGGTPSVVIALYALDVLIGVRLKNLYLDGGVKTSADGAFDPSEKLAFWAGGLVSHDDKLR